MLDIFGLRNRRNICSVKEIILWWDQGRLIINLFFFIISILHLLIVFFVLKNTWIVFYLPMLFLLLILINLFFSIGLLFELVSKLFKFRIDFNKAAPSIKAITIIVIVIALICLSFLDINEQL
jgi:hypothetical protein